VHYEFTPEGQTVNQDFYLSVLGQLQDAVQRKRPEMWTSGSQLLHHDDVPAHIALSVSRKTRNYDPSMTPPIHLTSHLLSFLFPKLKITHKGRFQTLEDIITNVTNDLGDTTNIL
jgi:hypothetical protein